jgi:hypothetical protein
MERKMKRNIRALSDFVNSLREDFEEDLINLEYYPYPIKHIKYQIQTDNYFEDSGLISYQHGGVIVESRELSVIEMQSVLSLLKKIQLPVLFNRDESFVIMNPCIESLIAIKTPNLKANLIWTSEDTENYAAQMMNILELVDLIRSLIDIDFSKLEMPAYL